jgi:hypothetical protein
MNAGWTAFLTVLAVVFVFVVGQTLQRFLLEPIQEQRRVLGEIASVLLYHDNVGRFIIRGVRNDNPAWQSRDEVGVALRKLAGELRTTRSVIPAYRFLERTPWVVKSENLMTASDSLAGWSNAVLLANEDTAEEHKNKIAESLGILRYAPVHHP